MFSLIKRYELNLLATCFGETENSVNNLLSQIKL